MARTKSVKVKHPSAIVRFHELTSVMKQIVINLKIQSFFFIVWLLEFVYLKLEFCLFWCIHTHTWKNDVRLDHFKLM